MKKKILSLLMSLVMVAGLAAVPAGTANAASKKGAVIPVSFKDNVTWETTDWDNNRLSIGGWGADNVTLSSKATLSFTLYVSKDIFTKEAGEAGIHSLQVSYRLDVHDFDENGDWNWLGQLRSTGEPKIAKVDPNPENDSEGLYFDVPNLDYSEVVDTSAWASLEEEGDYYVLTIEDYPLGENLIRWDEEADKDVITPLDMSKLYNISMTIDCTPVNGVGGDAVFIVDDVQVKDSGNILMSENFESSEEAGNKWAPGDDEENWPEIRGSAYTTSLLSLKAKKANIKVGKKAKIKATAVAGTKVTYKSNKPKIASVDAKGNVKGLKKGKAVISVTCCGKTLKYTVKVSK